MKRLIIFLSTIAIFLLFFVSCYYDNEEALYPTFSTACDTTNVTYSGTIAPVLSSYCTTCHSGSVPSGSIVLTSYAGVQSIAANGTLMKALNGNGIPIMPPSGSLSACRIGQFRIWIRNGMVNN
ncbi:MAG: hypothetical protein WCS03_09570 [Bacteroidota bacterium]